MEISITPEVEHFAKKWGLTAVLRGKGVYFDLPAYPNFRFSISDSGYVRSQHYGKSSMYAQKETWNGTPLYKKYEARPTNLPDALNILEAYLERFGAGLKLVPKQ